MTTASITTTQKKHTAPTTFRSVSGFALPSGIHNNQPLLYCRFFYVWNFRRRLVRYYWYGGIWYWFSRFNYNGRIVGITQLDGVEPPSIIGPVGVFRGLHHKIHLHHIVPLIPQNSGEVLSFLYSPHRTQLDAREWPRQDCHLHLGRKLLPWRCDKMCVARRAEVQRMQAMQQTQEIQKISDLWLMLFIYIIYHLSSANWLRY